jgi:glycosyltransferase involved in cell wall biosynthesis
LSGQGNPFMTTYLYPLERKLIIVTVISDLATDYRVHKICQTLHENGFRVILTGSCSNGSLPLKARDYQTNRLKTWFGGSFLFYLEFNVRLFFKLFREKAGIYLGNDLDVMPATMLLARLKKKPIVYDSHEYFLGMAGLDKKPVRRSIWKFLETRVFSNLKYMYTVSESIRNLYLRNYHGKLLVVRNLPLKNPTFPVLTPEETEWIRSIEQKIPENKNLIIYQGAGINESRGVEELVKSMLFLKATDFHLLILGGGDVFEKLKEIIDQNHLSEKITIVSKVPFTLLFHITRKARLGISIDKPTVQNHKYSLPNKLFEYLHAGVPVLASRLVEQEKILSQYDVGGFIEEYRPEHIAQRIKEIFETPGLLDRWKRNTSKVREELNWENESKIVLDIFKQVEKDSVIK